MTDRIPCAFCGTLILPATAQINGGLCMPCKGGYRADLEAGKQRRALEREQENSPASAFWDALVQRVYKSAGGFEALRPAEKTYFALRCLIGEVYNGGFDQYFFNSAGSYYGFAVDGLMEVEATQSLQLLYRAKAVLFGEAVVPIDTGARRGFLHDSGARYAPALDDIDKAFCADPDQLDARCTLFAERRGLYAGY